MKLPLHWWRSCTFVCVDGANLVKQLRGDLEGAVGQPCPGLLELAHGIRSAEEQNALDARPGIVEQESLPVPLHQLVWDVQGWQRIVIRCTPRIHTASLSGIPPASRPNNFAEFLVVADGFKIVVRGPLGKDCRRDQMCRSFAGGSDCCGALSEPLPYHTTAVWASGAAG